MMEHGVVLICKVSYHSLSGQLKFETKFFQIHTFNTKTMTPPSVNGMYMQGLRQPINLDQPIEILGQNDIVIPGPIGRGFLHIKHTGMLAISLRGFNLDFGFA